MINDQVKETIKTHLKDYLEEKGINTNKAFNCLNPQHQDNNPSMSYDPKRNIVKCFSQCNCSYDLISLYALDNNLDERTDFKRIIDELALKYNVTNDTTIRNYTRVKEYQTPTKKEDYTIYLNKCKKDIDKCNYMQDKRGISDEIVKKYNIGYDKKENMIIIPVSNNYYLGRSVSDESYIKHHKPKGASNEIFNGHYIKDSDYKTILWVNESIIDSLSLEEINHDIKAIALNSTTNAKQLVQELRDNNFKGFIVIALDTDTTGIRASQELKEDLDALDIKSVIFNRDLTDYDVSDEIKAKDINELLLKDRDKLTNKVNNLNDMVFNMLEQQAIKKYQQENAYNYLDTFNQLIQDRDKNKPLSTGIDALDDALEGGFYKKNLIILGAISSLGKTTLTLQIADNVARNGNDVLIFSLEMAKEELIAKSLSRLSFLKAKDMHYTALALTTREILTGKGTNTLIPNNDKIRELYKDTLDDYKENIASNIYISECDEEHEINTDFIGKKVKDHITITGNKPLVIIDYLQIIQQEGKGLSDKQIIDRIVTNLKRIARENDITIVLISAFNRASYNQESNLSSFRDSSTIEYTSDVLISLQHEQLDGVNDDSKKVNTNQEQQKDERKLTLKVLKNRNGRISDVKGITFYAKYNYMYFSDKEY